MTDSSMDAKDLAQRMREAREYLNLSQQFVADQTGLPRSAISDIERGTRRVDSLELKHLAALYRRPMAYFLGQQDEVAESAVATEALARVTRGMEEPEMEQLLRFAQFLRSYGGEQSPEERRGST